MESDSTILFLKNKVYTISNGDLDGGYEYRIQNDSVIYNVLEIDLVELGQNAFLRKFSYGYILNIKHGRMNDWWHVKFIDTRNKSGVVIRDLSKKDLIKNKKFKILHEDYTNYLIAEWSKEEMKAFINNGGFSDTTLFLKYEEKTKTR
ncbi:MAG: hypothetical protein HKP14_10465 [Bacteroidia bacterium]|nr:hypothetical protein [Bacteroidia bacterium]